MVHGHRSSLQKTGRPWRRSAVCSDGRLVHNPGEVDLIFGVGFDITAKDKSAGIGTSSGTS